MVRTGKMGFGLPLQIGNDHTVIICYSLRANSVLRYRYFCFWGYNLVLVVALGEFSESCEKEGLGFQGDWTVLSLRV